MHREVHEQPDQRERDDEPDEQGAAAELPEGDAVVAHVDEPRVEDQLAVVTARDLAAHERLRRLVGDEHEHRRQRRQRSA